MREAVGDAMGVLACAAAAAAPNLAGGEAATNPLLRATLDALADQKREVQAAAAHAFAQARLTHDNPISLLQTHALDSRPKHACEWLAPTRTTCAVASFVRRCDRPPFLTAAVCWPPQVVSYAEPVTPAIWKQVVRLLSSPGFHARAALLPAVARLAPEPADGAPEPNPDPSSRLQVLGMVARAGAEGAAPHLQGLMGGGPGGDPAAEAGEFAGGLLGALAAGEWATRRAAADCLRALCVALGPQLDRAQVRQARVLKVQSLR